MAGATVVCGLSSVACMSMRMSMTMSIHMSMHMSMRMSMHISIHDVPSSVAYMFVHVLNANQKVKHALGGTVLLLWMYGRRHIWTWACAYTMCADMCVDMCKHFYRHADRRVCRHVCVGMSIDMHIDMCIDICVNTCTDIYIVCSRHL